jgi:hypothetical protein
VLLRGCRHARSRTASNIAWSVGSSKARSEGWDGMRADRRGSPVGPHTFVSMLFTRREALPADLLDHSGASLHMLPVCLDGCSLHAERPPDRVRLACASQSLCCAANSGPRMSAKTTITIHSNGPHGKLARGIRGRAIAPPIADNTIPMVMRPHRPGSRVRAAPPRNPRAGPPPR